MAPQQSQHATLELPLVGTAIRVSDETGTNPNTSSVQDLNNPPSQDIGDKYDHFRTAVRNADVEAMDRCAQVDAAPEMKWELPESGGCQCLSERPHTHHRPIDELLETVYLGQVPIGKCVDTLKWLLERRFDMTEQKDQHWYVANDYCDHVPEFLITILSKSPDRVRTEGICQMIKILHIYGYSLPFHMNFHSWWDIKEKPYSHFNISPLISDHDDPYNGIKVADKSIPGLIKGPLDVALRSHCPPYVLEFILRDYLRRLVDFDVAYVEPPPLMKDWAGKQYFWMPSCSSSTGNYTFDQPWWKFTNILGTIWGLFLDLMDISTSWVEQYRGEAADVFEQKIEILVEYRMLNQFEEKMLRGIVESMRSMTMPTKATSIAVVDDRDSQCCWNTLWGAIIPFKTIKEEYILTVYHLDKPYIPYDGRRCHHFHIDPDWDVYVMYHNYQMQNDQIRPTLNRPWGSKGVIKRDDGTWVDREWRRVFYSRDRMTYGQRAWDPWRLLHWTDGRSYAEIDEAVCERWKELDAKKDLPPPPTPPLPLNPYGTWKSDALGSFDSSR
ncbi:hypothetical protein IL306_005719 [Fusarium sp. DS 682]|nr:hypothetical protein IL306_005719 [Fusarium sp. DS 682]